MMDRDKIAAIAEAQTAGGELFVVEITVSAASDIEIVVDSDSRVSIGQCATLSRAIEEQLDREAEDFSLTVSSAGIGYPLKVERQFAKCVGCDVEVVLKTGGKLSGKLTAYDSDGIDLQYSEKVSVEGKKRKETVEKVTKYNFSEIKSVCEALTIK